MKINRDYIAAGLLALGSISTMGSGHDMMVNSPINSQYRPPETREEQTALANRMGLDAGIFSLGLISFLSLYCVELSKDVYDTDLY